MACKHVYFANGCSGSQRLSGKPLNVPLARTLDISNLNSEGTEIESRHGVEGHIKDDQRPLEEGVSRVSWFTVLVGQISMALNHCLTSSDTMHLVLNEEVDQWHKSAEKGRCQVFAIFDGLRIGGAECDTASRPRKRRNNVGNHENIMPIVIVCRCNVCPAATG
jgi:hypothetical protein